MIRKSGHPHGGESDNALYFLRGCPRNSLDQAWVISGYYLDTTWILSRLSWITGHTHRGWDFGNMRYFRNISEEPLVPPSEFHTTFQLAASWNLSVASAFPILSHSSGGSVAREPSLRIWMVSVLGLKLFPKHFTSSSGLINFTLY